MQSQIAQLDFAPYWAFFLLLVRFGATFISLPGVGTDQIPATFRTSFALGLAFAVASAGARAPEPASIAQGGMMIAAEFMFGYLMGLIPFFIIGGVTVAGQVTTGAIGLGQANMIDHSLGESVAVLARLEGLLAAVIFLLIDGHHMVIRAAAATGGDLSLGLFRPDMPLADLLTDRLTASFDLSLKIAAPILVTLLVTQFVLGLLTKFVPQVNIFIISLPLTIGIGLFITGFTFTGFSHYIAIEFVNTEESVVKLFQFTGQ